MVERNYTGHHASFHTCWLEPRLARTLAVRSGYDGVPIVRGLSLTIKQGASTAIVGRNGVGKTTLVKTIMGLVTATSGRIVFDDRDITLIDARQRARLGLGYVPQGRGIFSRLTVFENLCMGELVGIPRDRYEYERIYDLFPILKDRLVESRHAERRRAADASDWAYSVRATLYPRA